MAVASTWPQSRQTAQDLNGDVVPSARLYFFRAGTTTPLVVYSDPALTTPLPAFPDPIEADASGRWPRIFLPYVDYRERVTTPDGTLLWDDDGIANPNPSASSGGGSTPEAERFTTGDPKWSFDPDQQPGFVRLNARTIGNGVSGATERAHDDTRPLYVKLWGLLDDTVCPVSTGRGSTAEADYASGKTLGLPDWRGRAPFGLDTMGNTAANRLVGATFGHGDAVTSGSYGGAATNTLAGANLPATQPAITVNDTSQKSISFTTANIQVGTGSTQQVVTNVLTSGGTTTVQTTQTTTGSVTATNAALGSAAAFNNMPGFGLITWHVKL